MIQFIASLISGSFREDNNSLLLPTQRIFLSHSGFQKRFVEELYWDLKNHGHAPFFGESPESLLKGKGFPELIVQAARQYDVAVVVLSDKYLMSKWPMLELVAFVDAQRTCNPRLHILPLFYELDVCDLKDNSAIHRWMAEWESLAMMDARVDPNKCEDALRVFTRSNGERFSKFGGSEFRYRKAIVASLCQLSRPFIKYDTPSMVGRTRLCKKIVDELERRNRVNGCRPAALGLHGLGGMGKTLLCKALCSHFREEYAGRVCHTECSKLQGSGLELQKMILDELTDANKDAVRLLQTSEETETEALELFLQSAVSTLPLKFLRSYFTDQHLEILKDCIKQCFSSNDLGGHYNPMLLQALGCSIREADFAKPQDLIEKCRMWGKLQHFHKHAVFDILKTEYDALRPERYKLLFLDVALFAPREKLRNLDDICTCLEAMHDFCREEILHKLRELRRSSLLGGLEDLNTLSQITLHDLYKDFAAYELRDVEEAKRWAVYHEGGLADLPQNLESSPSGRNWPDLVRVSIRIENPLSGAGSLRPHLHFLASPPVMFPTREKIQEWENLQLLRLEGFESLVFDIGPLKCLRSLKLVSYALRTLLGCHGLKQLRFVELDCSGLREGLGFSRCSKLQELVTGRIYLLREIVRLPSAFSDLKRFKLNGWNTYLPDVLDLQNHPLLTEVAVANRIWDTGHGRLRGFRSLSIAGLSFLTSLVGLTLINLPINSLPGLESLVSLKLLNLRGCAKLGALPDLSELIRLAWVDRRRCKTLPSGQPLVS